MIITLICLAALLLFVTGTPILLIIAGWVVATSYFVADLSLNNIGIGAVDTITSFVFLAVPLFIATGDFLTEGGISKRLVDFSRSLTAAFPARTSCAAILSSGFFAAVSGSNSATAATIGRMLNGELTATGMKPSLSAAIIAAGGVVGVIIPPSVIFVVYGITVNVSASDLFVAGIIPGGVMLVTMMATSLVVARKSEPGEGWKGFNLRKIASSAVRAWLGFIAIGLIFFGVYDGLFSPTEAAGVVTLFCLLAGLFVTRQIRLRAVPSILLRSAAITGMIVPLVAFSVQFQQVLGVLGAAEAIQSLLDGVGANYGIVAAVLLMMLMILAVGAMTESVAVVLILGPILAPVAYGLGIDPIHWGVIFVVGTSIGFITPPYGLNLFVVSAVCNVPYGHVMRSILVMLIPLLLAWALITVSPWMSTWLLPGR